MLYSVRFTLTNGSDIIISYSKQEELISIKCKANKVLFLGNTIVPSFEERFFNIQFYVSLDDANSIANKLHCPLNVTR